VFGWECLLEPSRLGAAPRSKPERLQRPADHRKSSRARIRSCKSDLVSTLAGDLLYDRVQADRVDVVGSVRGQVSVQVKRSAKK
jgi:hypothetical protein